MMILVTGATGNIGSELVPQLLTKGAAVRVISRDPEKAARLDSRVERVIGDLHQPSVIEQALHGVDRVFMVSILFEKNHEADRLLIDSATRAGVRHIVKISSSNVSVGEKGGIGGLHREKEQFVEESGIPWTFLRPGGFMSNALQWVETIKKQSQEYNPTGNGKFSPIAPHDIAAVAAVALTSAGRELLSVPDQVRILSEVIGKPIRCVDIPIAAAMERMKANGLPESLAESLANVCTRILEGRGTSQTDEVEKVTGKPAQKFESWCRQHRGAFV